MLYPSILLIQSNFYRVIRRMVTLLSNNACLDVEKEAAMKQAQSASRAAEELMKGGDGSGELKEKLAQKDLGKLTHDMKFKPYATITC